MDSALVQLSAFLSRIHDPEFSRAKTYWREGPKGAPDSN
jgi:hypothetical protein